MEHLSLEYYFSRESFSLMLLFCVGENRQEGAIRGCLKVMGPFLQAEMARHNHQIRAKRVVRKLKTSAFRVFTCGEAGPRV